MLDHLDRIPWSDLRQAHGHAAHVPAAVRRLLSEDEQEVRAAKWQLDNYVVFQGDLYEAAAFLPPFLIEALDRADSCGKVAILDLLFEIGNGYAPPEQKLRFELTGSGEWKPISAEKAPSITEACFRGVMTGLDCYRIELRSSDPTVRQRAKELVKMLLDR